MKYDKIILDDGYRRIEQVLSLDGVTISGYNVEVTTGVPRPSTGKIVWEFYRCAYTKERAMKIYNELNQHSKV